jgi:hypothetical protein
MKPPEQKRSERRMKRRTFAWITGSDRARHKCEVIDVSTHGMKVSVNSSFCFPTDFGVELVPNALPRPGKLAWRNGSMAGIEFSS